MDLRKPPLIVIVGPTAAGKSALAVRLAKKFNGEIISADSRQVYRGLDIGTGKISPQEMRGIRHHLLDIANPRQQFSVAQFQRLAHRAIREIRKRGKVPLLVGGTGFWVDAVAYGLKLPPVPPNPALRRRLARKSAAELWGLLRRIDPERARTIERGNPRRLIRAIEIARALGGVPKLEKRPAYRTLFIGVRPPPETLRRLIRTRLIKRLRGGLIREAQRLRAQGLTWKRFSELGLEYRFLADYLRSKLTMPEMIARLEKAISRYARHQVSWFRRNPSIGWVSGTEEAERLVRKFLNAGTRR